MSDLKQFTGRRTSAHEHLMRALETGLARTEGTHTSGPLAGTTRVAWMPGFVPVEYLRAENRDRLGVTEVDPVLGGRPSPRLVPATGGV